MTDPFPFEPRQPQPRTGNRRMRQLSSTQVMFAVILAVGLMLAVNFSSRIVADRSLSEIENQVLQEIELLKHEQSDLVDRLDYVQSDAYVEDWARSEGKMVRDGEVLVRPVPSTSAVQPTPVAQDVVPVDTTLPEPENWQVWWSLFFDTVPPGM